MPQRTFRRCVGLLAALVSLCALGTFLSAPVSRAQGGEPRYFAIKGARIVPVSGPAIEDGTVVVADGLIKAVGASVTIPPEAWVMDGKGLTVYPGLIDALTDVGLGAPAAPTPGAGGSGGGPRSVVPQKISMGPEDRPGSTPWVIAADGIQADDKRIETWRSGGFTTALVAPKGGMLPGQGSVVNLAGERPGDMIVKSPATLNVSFQPAGSFFSFPGSLMGAIAYIRQVFIDTRWYESAASVYDAHPKGLERPPYDRTEQAVAHAWRNKELTLIPANNDVQILRALRLIDEWKISAAIYGAQQGYDTAAAIAAKKIPVLVSLKWPEREKDADPQGEQDLRVLQFRALAPSSPAALAKAGVKFAFYSDGLANPKEVLKNAKKAVDAGLAPDAALRAFTLSAAEVLGVDDRLGSVEPGKIANLVVADGDLFNPKTKIKFVFVDGRRFEIREEEKSQESPKGSLTGKWKLSYTTPDGPEEGTLDVVMATDGSLSGTFTSPHGTQSISSGSVSGNSFHLGFTLLMGDESIDVRISGTFEGTTMKGGITAGDLAIDFTGTRPEGA